MNLHIDTNEYDHLLNQSYIEPIIFGSRLYNVIDKNSDTDLMFIMFPFKNLSNNPFTNHHQFQYKDIINKRDCIFIDITGFIKNLVSGDSTVNYEILYSADFKKSALGFLSDIIPHFATYNLIKSYVGTVERDIKHFKKRVGDDVYSGIVHIQRGINFAESLLNYKAISFQNIKQFKDNVKDFDSREKIELFLQNSLKEIKEFRLTKLNPAFEKKLIPRFLNPDIQSYIASKILLLNQINDTNNLLSYSLLYRLYEVNENPEIKYD